MDMKKIKIKNKDDWARFTIGYLALSELTFRELATRKYDDSEKEYRIDEVYIPAVFNLKHGIEIFLKALSIEFLEKKQLDKSDHSHDIDEIFTRLRKDVGENRIQKSIEIYNKRNTDSPYEGSGKSILTELKRLVEKYYKLDFLKDKIEKDYSITDINNEAFRYPTNNLNITIDYQKISKRFTIDDVEQSRLDSVRLEKIFYQLYLLIYVEKNLK